MRADDHDRQHAEAGHAGDQRGLAEQLAGDVGAAGGPQRGVADRPLVEVAGDLVVAGEGDEPRQERERGPGEDQDHRRIGGEVVGERGVAVRRRTGGACGSPRPARALALAVTVLARPSCSTRAASSRTMLHIDAARGAGDEQVQQDEDERPARAQGLAQVEAWRPGRRRARSCCLGRPRAARYQVFGLSSRERSAGRSQRRRSAIRIAGDFLAFRASSPHGGADDVERPRGVRP
jgi:hypothetical protein